MAPASKSSARWLTPDGAFPRLVPSRSLPQTSALQILRDPPTMAGGATRPGLISICRIRCSLAWPKQWEASSPCSFGGDHLLTVYALHRSEILHRSCGLSQLCLCLFSTVTSNLLLRRTHEVQPDCINMKIAPQMHAWSFLRLQHLLYIVSNTHQ